MLVHGARAVVRTAAGKSDQVSQWVNALRDTDHIAIELDLIGRKPCGRKSRRENHDAIGNLL